MSTIGYSSRAAVCGPTADEGRTHLVEVLSDAGRALQKQSRAAQTIIIDRCVPAAAQPCTTSMEGVSPRSQLSHAATLP